MASSRPLDPGERLRYARHLTLPGVGETGQRALRDARVLVVGAGGLGAPVVSYLSAAGVGVIGVVDDDVVERSNLQRQVIHTEAGVGEAKVSSAARFASQLNSGVTIMEHRVRLDARTALEILPEYDVVVDGSDNFSTRYVLNDACVALRLPLVWASISQFSGQFGVVVPGVGPCYRCLFPHPLADGEVPDCAVGGVLGVLPGVVGTMEAVEVIKLVTGAGEVARDGVWLYDALSTSLTRLPLARDAQCVVCGDGDQRLFEGLDEAGRGSDVGASGAEVGEVCEIDAAELAALGDPFVVDVREQTEVDASPVPAGWGEVVVRPLSAWESSTGRELLTAAQGRDVVTVCAAGSRSARAARVLLDESREQTGPRIMSLAGGLAAWKEQAEPRARELD